MKIKTSMAMNIVSLSSPVPEEDMKDNWNSQYSADKLAQGLLEIYQPDLERIRNLLQELTDKQASLVTQLDAENNKLFNPTSKQHLEEMTAMIEVYTVKLVNIKKEMHLAAEKMSHLKKRAAWLQSTKHKEVLHQEYQRELQIQREQELIAKPTTTSPTS